MKVIGMLFKGLILTSFTLLNITVSAQKIFNNIDSLLSYASYKSISLQLDEIKFNQAKRAKLAAVLGIPDFSGSTSFSYTNNTKLPVNLFPAEIFGGQVGTFQEVQTGVQYVSNQNIYIDAKLLNFQGWENLRLSKINIESTVIDSKINRKTLYENVATLYFNIVNLKEQLKASKENLSVADTLLQITQLKYSQGLIKQQDLNDAQVNVMSSEEKLNQIQLSIKQQYLGLKILCDIPEDEVIEISQSFQFEPFTLLPEIDFNPLAINAQLLKEQMAFSTFKQLKLGQLPTISLFFSQTTQQFNTQGKIFDSNVRWIPSNYVGLRLSIPIPSSSTIAQISKTKFDYELAKKNTEHIRIHSTLTNQQLNLDYQKAFSQYQNHQKSYALLKDTYLKNVLNYAEGIISMNQTLNSYNAMINSNYNLISSGVNVLFVQSKISINNRVK